MSTSTRTTTRRTTTTAKQPKVAKTRKPTTEQQKPTKVAKTRKPATDAKAMVAPKFTLVEGPDVPTPAELRAEWIAQQNVPTQPLKPTTLLIAGSRSATRALLEMACSAVIRAHELGWKILVGDNPWGADDIVRRTAEAIGADYTIVGLAETPRAGNPQHYVQMTEAQLIAVGGGAYNVYTARDRFMVLKATRVLCLQHNDSPGTADVYSYALGQGRKVDIRRF